MIIFPPAIILYLQALDNNSSPCHFLLSLCVINNETLLHFLSCLCVVCCHLFHVQFTLPHLSMLYRLRKFWMITQFMYVLFILCLFVLFSTRRINIGHSLLSQWSINSQWTNVHIYCHQHNRIQVPVQLSTMAAQRQGEGTNVYISTQWFYILKCVLFHLRNV